MSEATRLEPKLVPDLDYSKVFLTYVSLLGNALQTAHACELAVEQVMLLAKRDNWDAKVRALLDVKERQGAEAFARELNRTANFIQALRCRNLLDQTIQFFTNASVARGSKICLEQLLTHRDTKGNVNLSAKNIADLTKALESVHRMTYAALGDTTAERPKGKKDDDEATGDPSLAMVRALSQLNDVPGAPALSEGGPAGDAEVDE